MVKQIAKEAYVVGDVYRMNVDRGDQFNLVITFRFGTTPIDLTGYTFELLDSDLEAIPSALSAASPTNGQILVHFAPAQTLVMVDQAFRLRIVQGGNPTTLLEGRIDVS